MFLTRSSSRYALIAVALLLIFGGSAHAGSGGLDPTFGQGGVARIPVSDVIGGWFVSLPDGGVVVAANSSGPPIPRIMLIARLRPDGTLDPAFGDGGIAHPSFGTDTEQIRDGVQALRRQPDGRLLLAGNSIDRVGGTSSLGVTRLLPNGAPDPTFGDGGVVLIAPIDGERVTDLVIQSDGGIVLGGDAAFVDRRKIVLRRLDSTGTVDSTFGSSGVIVNEPDAGVSNQFGALVRWPDDSIGAVGVAFEGEPVSVSVSTIARFHSDGTPDEHFGNGGAVVLRNGEWPVDGAVTSGGQLVVLTSGFGAFRLLDDGTVDATFGVGGVAQFPFGATANAFAMALDAEQRLVLAGEAPPDSLHPYQAAVARLTADGLPDSDFGAGGAVLTPIGSSAVAIGVDVQADGRIVAAGFADGRPAPFGHIVFVTRYDPAFPAGGGCAPASARVFLRRLDPPLGDELVSVSATFDPGADAVVDPIVSGVRVAILAADGTPLLNLATPGGVFNRRFGGGWRVRSGGRGWSYDDTTGTSGVGGLVVKRVGDHRLRVTIRAQKPVSVPPGASPLRIRVDVPEALCGAATFADGDCDVGPSQVVCR